MKYNEDLNRLVGELLWNKRQIEVQISINEKHISIYKKYLDKATTVNERFKWEDEIKRCKEQNHALGYELINTQRKISDLLDKEGE